MMKKLLWIVVAGVACLAGCAPSYRVHVNTYSELDGPVGPTAPIYIAVDPNSQNPILRRQIASKIRDLLEGNGYRPVENPDGAAYLLTFELGIDSERVLDYAPIHSSFGRYYGGHFGWGLGYMTYIPYVDTIYTHWLRMRLYATKDAEQKKDNAETVRQSDRQVVWLGEAIVGTDNAELREAVDYLLVACLEYFGADTEEWVTTTIQPDDPRVLGISAE